MCVVLFSDRIQVKDLINLLNQVIEPLGHLQWFSWLQIKLYVVKNMFFFLLPNLP